MSDETLPGVPSIADVSIHTPPPATRDSRSLKDPLAQTITDIAELGSQGLRGGYVNIIEGTDEPGQRHIPFEPHERGVSEEWRGGRLQQA